MPGGTFCPKLDVTACVGDGTVWSNYMWAYFSSYDRFICHSFI